VQGRSNRARPSPLQNWKAKHNKAFVFVALTSFKYEARRREKYALPDAWLVAFGLGARHGSAAERSLFIAIMERMCLI